MPGRRTVPRLPETTIAALAARVVHLEGCRECRRAMLRGDRRLLCAVGMEMVDG